MLKEYCFGTNCKQGFYLIDSNILIAMGNLYYKGKCKSEELKNEIIDFILTARRYGVQNQFALVELCYDYNTNQINTEAMQKIMIAYDNLLTSMSDDEIVNHKGAGDICINNKDKQQKNYESIYDCNLPLYMFGEMFAQMGNPIFIKFVTADKPLQDFMDHVNTYNTVISKDMITSLNIYNTDVAEKYREKWADYSNNVMNPIMKDRYFQLHLGGSKLSLDFEENVKKNIILLEQEILCKNEI